MADDLKAALRSLRSSKTFTAVALIVLALGIGASTAIFSVVDAVVLRGLPFDEHDRLVAVGERRPPGPNPDPMWDPNGLSSAAPQNYMDWAAQQRVFDSIATIAGGAFTLRDPGAEPEDLRSQQVTAGFFDVLRVRPSIGGTFTVENEIDGRHRVAVLSDGLWRRRFGGDPAIVGRTIPLQRTREIAVRMARGATRGNVVRMVLTNACVLVAAGLAIGGAGAWYLSAAAKSFLFRMETTDPRAFAVAIALLAVAAMIASAIPARRAAGVDPMVALRAE